MAAKTYLQVHPTAQLAIFESSSEIGGVWSPSRCYPFLKTNNQFGTFHTGDFPMPESRFGTRRGEHIPGRAMHEYLAAYAKHFDLFDYIQSNSKVEIAECREDDGWLLSISSAVRKADKRILARKLIVATGLTSQAFVPQLPGSETFQGPIVHSKHLAQRDQMLRGMSSIVVLGNNKSAYDAAYSYASQGIKVHLVIRQSGKGPLWMAPSIVTPFKVWIEWLLSMRLLSWFSPCVWGNADGYGFFRWFLNSTTIGRLLMSFLWMVLAMDVENALAFEKSAETEKLRPWTSPFWQGTSLSLLTYDGDFYGLVRSRQIEVHVSDVDKLLKDKVCLKSGAELESDALITATGWVHSPSIKFLPEGIEKDLGLPGYGYIDENELKLSKLADAEVLGRHPILKSQPKSLKRQSSPRQDRPRKQLSRPWRLFRFVVPPAFVSRRTIAFSGMLITVRTSTIAELQGLWITSFLDGSLNIESCLKQFSASESRRFEKDTLYARVLWDTMLMTQFGRWRHPSGFGDRAPDFVFDSLPYFDVLLGDLGLKKRRKKSWLLEIVGHYRPEDHGHIVEEWIELQKKNR